MRLKSIELLGFKSFAKKDRLDFSAPVIGIVGPNGSGKSNVVEAFRFVLGEQSMKSLRGKSGRDLIFKGSKDLPKASRASVEIAFDNHDKVFKLSDRSEPINLDYDDIILKREVFADGTNNYYINGTLVRLKDIVELLASVNIGSSGHHIISQGQADRILSSSAKDRRVMIEDALGLKVYQYKIKDAGKKLEKTAENMKEVASLRRELAPHIKYLKKQVEKVERGAELRRELADLYIAFFKSEDAYLSEEERVLKDATHANEKILKEVEVKLKAFAGGGGQDYDGERLLAEISKLESEDNALSRAKDELSRKLGRLEGMIEMENRQNRGGENSVSIKSGEFEKFLSEADNLIDEIVEDEDLEVIKGHVLVLKEILENFGKKFSHDRPETVTTSFKDLETTKKEVAGQLAEIDKTKKDLADKVSALRAKTEAARTQVLKDQEARFLLETEKNRLAGEAEVLKVRLESFKNRKTIFEEASKEAVALVGSQILDYRGKQSSAGAAGEDLRRQIERIKIKLEDIGTGSGDDVMKEYESVTQRDTFLAGELEDLEKSIANLKDLIVELKETLEREFKNGLHDINQKFGEFFTRMFGGGSAYLSTVSQSPRKNSASLDDELSDMAADDENELDQGIEINVTLPQKKVKDLQMLSGGERSLTSIALVFAITQVNPPPFLVLDETDAALDEANSRRYGDMIEMLSKYSELITVTHNRETMSRANVIYGVTIGSDGASKLLSIKFTEAEEYAK